MPITIRSVASDTQPINVSPYGLVWAGCLWTPPQNAGNVAVAKEILFTAAKPVWSLKPVVDSGDFFTTSNLRAIATLLNELADLGDSLSVLTPERVCAVIAEGRLKQ